jgi:signal transduction histidine kinase
MIRPFSIFTQARRERFLLRNLQDYARAVETLTWQRQSILLGVSILTGWFFYPSWALLFFAISNLCEFIDLVLARRVGRIKHGDMLAANSVYAGFLANTVVSSLTICVYTIWVAGQSSGDGLFTSLFFLFSGALYAAINNHQVASLLITRMMFYGSAFLIMTLRDIVVYRPEMDSSMWLQFFTVIFVIYFLVDCSRVFLRMYRQDLKRLEDLRIEHARAKEALVLKSQFVAVVSHELRTPLTSIKGALDLVNSGNFGKLPPRVKHLLGMAGKNSQRLADLVNDLLDLQKLEEGELKFDCETVDVGAFLVDVLEWHQGLAGRYNVQFKMDEQALPLAFVSTDRARLMQVLGNIISNAAKFSLARGEVDLGMTVANQRVRITVRDRGVGIPEGSKEQIFARFIQLDSSDQRKFEGTGLGMNISKQIIEALGGVIGYDSVLGKGTTFYIELPSVPMVNVPVSTDNMAERGGAIQMRSVSA